MRGSKATNKQKRKTMRRKVRQESAFQRFLKHPKVDSTKRASFQRIGFYNLPQTAKQKIVEQFG